MCVCVCVYWCRGSELVCARPSQHCSASQDNTGAIMSDHVFLIRKAQITGRLSCSCCLPAHQRLRHGQKTGHPSAQIPPLAQTSSHLGGKTFTPTFMSPTGLLLPCLNGLIWIFVRGKRCQTLLFRGLRAVTIKNIHHFFLCLLMTLKIKETSSLLYRLR